MNGTLNVFTMQDKVIVVSGGAGGIGAEVCRRLSGLGALLVIADLNAEHSQATAKSMPNAIGLACDITNPEQCKALASATLKKYGRLDGVVNCAGVSKPHESISLPPADWARMVDVQLNGDFISCRPAPNT